MNRNMNANARVELYLRFTEAYQHYADDPAQREIACMRIQYPLWMLPIEEGDLLAGRGEFDQEIGFTPQALINKFGYFIDISKAETLLADPDLTPENRTAFAELTDYWKTEETVVRLRKRYPEAMRRLLPSDDWQGEAGIAFPLYRMSGTQLDFDKLLRRGLPGLRREAQELSATAGTEEKRSFYRNILAGFDLFVEVAAYYMDMALRQAGTARNERKKELREMAEALRRITIGPPSTLYEALQLSYLYCQLSGSINFGRVDEYLGDFLSEDIRAGRLDRQGAIRMIGRYWQLIEKRMRVYDSRLTIGGLGRRNPENADQFALCAIEAMREVKTVAPQITLRFHEGQDPALMEAALDAIGEGCTFPMLYNDEVNVPAVQQAFGVSRAEAENYIPFGCGEYTLYHKSVGTPSGVINLMAALLETLREGEHPTFEALTDAYKRKVETFVEQLALQEKMEYDMAGETAPFPLFSALYDDCMQKGFPIFGGGIRHLGGTLESYGGTNAADSLVAIRELIYERKELTTNELIHLLDTDFEGHEEERIRMMNLPKYGNDDDRADRLKTEIDRHVCQAAIRAGRQAGLDSYLVVFINNDANTILGRYTGASPDGRHAGTSMANGNAPSGGCDRNGVTALLNSMIKPDIRIHAGAVQNIKFSRSLFTEHRAQLKALLNGYFDNGGAQLMITVVDRGDLENALREPDKYRNLIVRVGGFSARFVELAPNVQQEILSRTLY